MTLLMCDHCHVNYAIHSCLVDNGNFECTEFELYKRFKLHVWCDDLNCVRVKEDELLSLGEGMIFEDLKYDD